MLLSSAHRPRVHHRTRVVRHRHWGTRETRSAAKYSPTTVTDVQIDGRPLALPGNTPRSSYVRATVLRWAARR
eukprot:scaffold16783_cov118-Isochrysis_galbana.AAC.1